MGIDFDGLKDKATDALREHSDKIEQGLDKAAEFAKARITGQDEKIDSGVEKAKDFLGKLTDKPGEEPPADQPPPE
jgi:hypothetical protein